METAIKRQWRIAYEEYQKKEKKNKYNMIEECIPPAKSSPRSLNQ